MSRRHVGSLAFLLSGVVAAGLAGRAPADEPLRTSTHRFCVGVPKDVYVDVPDRIHAPAYAFDDLPPGATWTNARQRLRWTPTAAGTFGPYTLTDGTHRFALTLVAHEPVDLSTVPWRLHHGSGARDAEAAHRLRGYLNRIAGSSVFAAPTAAPVRKPRNAIVVGRVAYAGWDLPTDDLGCMVARYREEDGAYQIAGNLPEGTVAAVGVFLMRFLGCRFYAPHHVPAADVSKGEFSGQDELVPSARPVLCPRYVEEVTHLERVDLAAGEGRHDFYQTHRGLVGPCFTYTNGSHGGLHAWETRLTRYGRARDWFDAYPPILTGLVGVLSGTVEGAIRPGDAVTFSGGGSGVFERQVGDWMVLRSATRRPAAGEAVRGPDGSFRLAGGVKDQGLPAPVRQRKVTGSFVPHEPLVLSPSGATARLAKHCRDGSLYAWLKDVVGTPQDGDVVTGSWSGATLTLAGAVLPDATIAPPWYRVAQPGGDPSSAPRAKGKLPCLTDPNVPDEFASMLRYQVEVEHVNPARTVIGLWQEDSFSTGSSRCLCARCEAVRIADGGPGSIHATLTPFCNAVLAKCREIYPSLRGVATYAYQATITPARANPDPGVIIRFAPIAVTTPHACCDFHGIDECPVNEQVRSALGAWAAKGCELDAWIYCTHFGGDTAAFRPMVRKMALDFQAYWRAGARGCYFQAPGHAHRSLQLYLASAIALEPWRHVDDVIEEFIAGYYGGAAGIVQEAWRLYEGTVRDPTDGTPTRHGTAWQKDAEAHAQWYTDDVVRALLARRSEALAAVAADAERTRRVEQFFVSLKIREGSYLSRFSSPEVVGEYVDDTHEGVPVRRRAAIARYVVPENVLIAKDSLRSATRSEFSDGVLERYGPVPLAGGRRVTLTHGDLAVVVIPEWYGQVVSIRRAGVELLHQPDRVRDGVSDDVTLWPLVPGLMHLSLCSGVAPSGLPRYAKLPDQALGELQGEPTSESCTVVWRSNIGAWQNGSGYGQLLRAVFSVGEDGDGRPRLQVALTAARHQAETRKNVSPVLETRWKATAREADSAFTPDVAGRSYTVLTPDGTRVTDALGAGIALRSGVAFRGQHDAGRAYLSVAAYLEAVPETAPAPGTTICRRTITFEDAR